MIYHTIKVPEETEWYLMEHAAAKKIKVEQLIEEIVEAAVRSASDNH